MGEIETWKSLVGWEGLYEISDFGRVRSLSRADHRGYRFKGRILTASTNSHGYSVVGLCGRGRQKTAKVHVEVLRAFRGERPVGFDACHNDGNSLNCKLSNLRWDTPTGNQADKSRHGTMAVGEKIGSAKLTEALVLMIRSVRRSGVSIARELGIHTNTVYRVRGRHGWKHI